MIFIKIIRDCLSIYKSVISNNIPKGEYTYRKISYIKIIEYKDKILAYNLLTDQLVEISKLEYSIIKNDQFNYNEILKELKENYFIVPISFNDKKLADSLFRIYSSFYNKTKKAYTILPTTVCNARCYYCFELNKEYHSMDTDMANNVAEFINKDSISNDIDIHWFGGEPLCNVKAIDIICSKLKSLGKNIKSSMTTNGSLFTDDIVNKAINLWNLKNVQITLDGTKDVYNKIKAYANIYNAFEQVDKNIERLLNNNVAVRVRLNVSLDNAEDLKQLCKYLASKYKKNRLFSVYTFMVLNHRNNKPYIDYDKKCIINKMIEINDYLFDSGIGMRDILKRKYQPNFCMADNDKHLVIYPNGKVGKCEYFISENFIGDIYNNHLCTSISDDWKFLKKNKCNCSNCLHYPRCFELDKCPNCFESCDEFDINLKDYLLEKRIINTYEKAIQKIEVGM